MILLDTNINLSDKLKALIIPAQPEHGKTDPYKFFILFIYHVIYDEKNVPKNLRIY